MLATNFGSLCPEVTNFGSQNFGYQIWFCTRLFSEILIEIQTFSFKEMQLKLLSAKWHPFCLRLNMLRSVVYETVGVQASCYFMDLAQDLLYFKALASWVHPYFGVHTATGISTNHAHLIKCGTVDNVNSEDLIKKRCHVQITGV